MKKILFIFFDLLLIFIFGFVITGFIVHKKKPKTEYYNLEILQDEDGYYVEFGQYPQFVSGDITPTATGLYFDEYEIFEDDNGRYIKCGTKYYTSENNIYFNNGTLFECYKLFYFKLEPIRWDIKGYYDENGKLNVYNKTAYESNITQNLVVCSHYIMDYLSWNEEQTLVNYNKTTVHKFLNEKFYNIVFNESQKLHINTHKVSFFNATKEVEGNTLYENSKVWLLSVSEVVKFDKVQSDRITYPTDYAILLGCWPYENYSTGIREGGQFWRTRDSHFYDSNTYFANYISSAGNSGSTYITTKQGVKPAMLINI